MTMNKWSLLGLFIGLAASIWYIRNDSYNDGLTAGRLECSQGQTQQAADALNQFIAGTKALTAQANAASQQLAQQIADRAAADDQSTREIRDALKKTAGRRVNCEFDADVMQQLAAAQQRAATATTSGIASRIGGTVPATGAAER
ncbi:TPA: hypothetical protein K8N54_004824 [Serratia marcescens]|uniref:hypothetical protein n=1 Tax=Serratia marcescens TaxID=615 RepID=UPI001C776BB8|nr:hypothetical protein [Serratia marcescens]BCZ41311.1 hypothetical protein SMGES_26370 [Serratia marcescens]HBI6269919.1 hypothetical protein [Serratia marcescens]HBI6952383.1 hypothetical protein [Serratia marcescens]HBI6960466.1 hypothetical protein [Serratia marcescens]